MSAAAPTVHLGDIIEGPVIDCHRTELQLVRHTMLPICLSHHWHQECPAHQVESMLAGPLGSGKLGQAVEDTYEESFDEGAAQVQRLLSRDRKELTGIEDIGQGFQTEFDDDVPEKKQPETNGAKQPASKPTSTFSSGTRTRGPPNQYFS